MRKILLSGVAFLLTTSTEAQHWWKPTKNEIIGYSSVVLAGVSNGFNQAIEHHSYGLGKPFVDISQSFKRKYKDYDGGNFKEAYFGSKTFLVWTTDAFHLSNTLEKGFLITGVTFDVWDIKFELNKYEKKDRWKVILFRKILFPLLLQNLTFEATFNNLYPGKR
jgi:hypothetical protein